jgi:hypothetical protein
VKTIFVAIIGDWDGGHHGQYPILLGYSSDRKEAPFSSSQGWGYGFSGNFYSLEGLVKYDLIEEYNRKESIWAYEILKHCIANRLNDHEASELLLESLNDNSPIVPDELWCKLQNYA